MNVSPTGRIVPLRKSVCYSCIYVGMAVVVVSVLVIAGLLHWALQ